jgi:hypothetical protein
MTTSKISWRITTTDATVPRLGYCVSTCVIS